MRTFDPILAAIWLSVMLFAREASCSAPEENAQSTLDDPTKYFEVNSLASHFDFKLTFDDYIMHSMRSLKLIAGFDNDLHRYDRPKDLMSSFSRDEKRLNSQVTDEEAGLDSYLHIYNMSEQEREFFHNQSAHLISLVDRFQVECDLDLQVLLDEASDMYASFQAFSSSKRLCLIDYFDSFGSIESQFTKGNFMWLGSPSQCAESRLSSVLDGYLHSDQSTRYCIANFRSPSWDVQTNVAGKLGGESIKLGVCLPKSCNSLSILRYRDKLERLIKLVRLNQVPFNEYKLEALYCLPDEDSPLRQFSWSARLFIIVCLCWFSVLIYQSIRYEQYIISVNYHTDSRHKPTNISHYRMTNLMRIFALRVSFQRLFTSETTSSQNKISQSNNRADSISAMIPSIDGIKVISMIWLIAAHTLLFFMRTISNGRDFWSILRDARFMTIMAGIFPVDTFFTVTGVLTAYLKLSKQDPVLRASYWLETFVHRYFRFMPMYLLIFWYTRDVSEYIGSGPLWDYATADTSLRAVCKEESITVPLLFQANFKRIDEHCVKPAWYIANDYQYLLLTPIFMVLLVKSQRIAYSIMGLVIGGSLILQFLTVFSSSEVKDFETLINFKPMFATYVLKDLWKLYVLPYNRIAPYFVGLITGHLLFKELLKHQNTMKEEEVKSQETCWDVNTMGNSRVSTSSNLDTNKQSSHKQQLMLNTYQTTETSQPNIVGGGKKIWIPIISLISIIYLPLITKLFSFQGLAAKIGTSSIMALMRFVWSLAIARLIYICSTKDLSKDRQKVDSFVIKLLSSPIWKPWSKIGLSALLIQWEVISYLAQIQISPPNMSIVLLLSTVLLSIVVTYTISLIIYLTIEYPLSQIEHLYIKPLIPMLKLFSNKTHGS